MINKSINQSTNLNPFLPSEVESLRQNQAEECADFAQSTSCCFIFAQE
jgi:hypothetical protein